MKKFIAGLIVGVLLSTTTLAFAAVQTVKLKVNGSYIEFSDAPPQILNGRTMVPARPLAEALGATVDWDAVNKTVVVTSGSQVVVDSQSITVIGPYDTVQAKMKDGYIEFRPIPQSLGATVDAKGNVFINGQLENIAADKITIDSKSYIKLNNPEALNAVTYTFDGQTLVFSYK